MTEPILNSDTSQHSTDDADAVGFVTEEDHLAGYKDLIVFARATGDELRIRLHAPSRRETRRLNLQSLDDLDHLVAACRPQELRVESGGVESPSGEAPDTRASSAPLNSDPSQLSTDSKSLLDRVTPMSAALIEYVAQCLTFGLDAQKKMHAAIMEGTRDSGPVARGQSLRPTDRPQTCASPPSPQPPAPGPSSPSLSPKPASADQDSTSEKSTVGPTPSSTSSTAPPAPSSSITLPSKVTPSGEPTNSNASPPNSTATRPPRKANAASAPPIN